MKILQKSNESLSDNLTKPKLTSNYINNSIQVKKTKKGLKNTSEEWLIPFQTMRNEIISGCSTAELDQAWKFGNKQEFVNDENAYLKKDSIFWEEEEDLLILHYCFSPDRFSYQMKNLLKSKDPKAIFQRYIFLNIQISKEQIERIQGINGQLQYIQKVKKALE